MSGVKTMSMEYNLFGEKGTGTIEGSVDLIMQENRRLYSVALREMDRQQFISRFVWEGLPENIDPSFMENIIYWRGSVAVFRFGGNYYALPWVLQGGINVNGFPIKIRPITFNGGVLGDSVEYAFGKDFELFVNAGGDYDPEATAVIIYDAPPVGGSGTVVPRAIMQRPFISEIGDRLGALSATLRSSRDRLVMFAKNEAQRRSIERQLQDYTDNVFTGVRVLVSRSTVTDEALPTVDKGTDYDEQAIWEDLTSLDNYRQKMLGIDNNGTFNKKERAITAEMSPNNDQTSLILQAGLTARKWAAELMNDLFGLSVTVELNTSLNGSDGATDAYSENGGDILPSSGSVE